MPLPKIDHPIYKFEIPSSKKVISVRPMLGKEEKLLLMAKESEAEEDILLAIKQVCNQCMLGSMDVDELTIFDLELLFIKLRSWSVSNLINVSYKDSEDNETYDFQIDLNTVTVNFPENIEKIIKVDGKVSIRMKYLGAGIYSNKDFLNADKKKMLDMLMKLSIDAIIVDGRATSFHNEVSDQEQQDFIDSLPITTIEKLREFLSTLPTVYHELKYTNKHGHERKIELTTLNDFFTLR